MKALFKASFTLLALCAITFSSHASVIIESAAEGGYGVTTGGATIETGQWIGFGFELTEQKSFTWGGAHVFSLWDDTTVFLAVVPLSGPGDLPDGNPFNPGEVLGSTLLSPLKNVPSGMQYNALPLTLDAGYYGVILGTGQLGATGTASAPSSGANILTDSFSHNSLGWDAAGFTRVRIALGDGTTPLSTVPEPSAALAVVALGLLCFGAHSTSKRLQRHSQN